MNTANCIGCIYLFEVTKRRKMFCSKDCRQAWELWDSERRGGYWTDCPECGVKYYRKARRVREGKFLYCSRLCAVKNMKKTWIEEVLLDAMIALGVDYREQEELLDRWIVDAYLPAYKLVIEAQGSYWHGVRRLKDGRQTGAQRRQASDEKKRHALLAAGYNILEIDEEEFRHFEWVKRKISEMIELCSK